MELTSDLVPAEQQDGEEAGFQEEREDAFGGQGAAEHIAHVTGVGSPVGAELEFHHNPGGDSDGERQRKHPGPESRQLVVQVVAGFQPEPFHDDDAHSQANGLRRVDAVEGDGERELDSGEEQHVHDDC